MPVNSKLYDYDAGIKLCKINTDLNAYKNGKFIQYCKNFILKVCYVKLQCGAKATCQSRKIKKFYTNITYQLSNYNCYPGPCKS